MWERCLPAIRPDAIHFTSRGPYRGQAPLPQRSRFKCRSEFARDDVDSGAGMLWLNTGFPKLVMRHPVKSFLQKRR